MISSVRSTRVGPTPASRSYWSADRECGPTSTGPRCSTPTATRRPLSTSDRARTVSALSQPPHKRGTFLYSNLGYVVAGAAIDRITGMPYEEALRIHLLDPLEIRSAGWGPPPHIWGHAGRHGFGGLVVGKGAPAEPDDVRSDNPPVMSPAGRLHLTLADWARFQQLFLAEGLGLLDPATVARLLHAPAGKGAGMAMGWAPAAALGKASYGMQGSNTFWVATALIDADLQRTAIVVTNDGRTRVLRRTAQLALDLLA